MAVTSVDINREALDQLKASLNVRTDREAINTAIARALALSQQSETLKRLAEIQLTDEDIRATRVNYPL